MLSRPSASTQVLESKDLQQLRGLITNDPLRAIQVLPGVATGDDFKSEFTVRGSPIDHMQFTFEGIDTPLLIHTVLRIPAYARLDLRLNRTFTRRETRLTLFAEVLNGLDRNDVREGTPGINPATFQATHLFDPLFPRTPSAGILVEF